MDSVRRIGFIGCAGLGKSAIAETVALSLGLPLLRSKDITRPILERHGYRYSEECPVETFLGVPQIECEIVESRVREESLLTGGFVTDRTTLECFAYALLCAHRYTEEDLAILEDECREHLLTYSHLFFFPQKTGWLEYNGVRTMSSPFQRHIDCLIRGLLEEWQQEVGSQFWDIPEYVRSQKDKTDFILGVFRH